MAEASGPPLEHRTEEPPPGRLPRGPRLVADVRDVARRLRDAGEAGLPGPTAVELAEALRCAADGLELVLLRAIGRQRPTHFVGLRMPPLLRRRLEAAQRRLAALDPALDPARVPPEKAHASLLVLRLEPGEASAASEALARAASAWRREARAAALRLRGLGAFAQNGVLFAELGPAEGLRALRAHVLGEFRAGGLEASDDAAPADARALEAQAEEVEALGGDDAPAADELRPRRGHGDFHPHVTLLKASQAGRGEHRGKREEAAAKKAIGRLGHALALTPAAVELDFGDCPWGSAELVDMRSVQEDGYYEVLAEAVLDSVVAADPAPAEVPRREKGPPRGFAAGEEVLVEWGGEWHAAVVERPKKGAYRVLYEEDGSFEVVPVARLRPRGGARSPEERAAEAASLGADFAEALAAVVAGARSAVEGPAKGAPGKPAGGKRRRKRGAARDGASDDCG